MKKHLMVYDATCTLCHNNIYTDKVCYIIKICFYMYVLTYKLMYMVMKLAPNGKRCSPLLKLLLETISIPINSTESNVSLCG